MVHRRALGAADSTSQRHPRCIPDTDTVFPHFPVSGAADSVSPRGVGRLHVDDVEPVAGRSAADDLRVCWHEASHATIGRHWSEVGGVTCQPGDGFSGLTWGPQYNRHAKFAENDEAPSLCEKIGPLMPAIGESRADVADIFCIASIESSNLSAGPKASACFCPVSRGLPPMTNDRQLPMRA
jgi:hypothetical protein